MNSMLEALFEPRPSVADEQRSMARLLAKMLLSLVLLGAATVLVEAVNDPYFARRLPVVAPTLVILTITYLFALYGRLSYIAPLTIGTTSLTCYLVLAISPTDHAAYMLLPVPVFFAVVLLPLRRAVIASIAILIGAVAVTFSFRSPTFLQHEASLILAFAALTTLILLLADCRNRISALHQSQLAASRDNLRAIADNANDGIIVVQLDGHHVFANKRFAGLVGHSIEQILTMEIRDLVPSSEYPLISRRVQQRLAGNPVPSQYETAVITRDGERVPVEVNATTMRWEGHDASLVVVRDIRGRLTAEAQLRRSEQLLNKTQEIAKLGSWEVDIPRNKTIWSAETYRIFGVDPDSFEPTPTHITELVHPDDRCRVTTAVQRALCDGSPMDIEYRVIHADGNLLYVHTDGLVIHSARGTPETLIATVQDVTERRHLDNQLQESRKMLQLILDTIPTRVFWKDLNSVFLGCNRSFAQDVGLENPEDIRGKDDFMLGTREHAESYQADDREIMRSGVPVLNYEEPLVDADGRGHVLSTSKIPLTNENDRVIGILGAYNDITELKESLAESQSARNYLQALYEATPDMIFLHNSSGLVIDVNQRAIETFGYDRNELLATDPIELIGTGTSSTSAKAKFAEVLDGANVDFEWQARRKDGSEFPIEVRLRRLSKATDHDNKRVVAVVRDISERKRQEAELVASEYRFRLLIETVESVILQIDKTGRIVEFNPAAEHLYGMSRDDVIGRELLSVFAPANQQSFAREELGRIMMGEPARSFENSVTAADGTQRVYLWYANCIEGPPGELTGIVVVGYDITDRRAAEMRLRAAHDELEVLVRERTARLQESEERFRQLAEAIDDIIWMISPEGDQVLYLNPAYDKIMGHPRSEAYEAPDSWLAFTYPDDRERLAAAFDTGIRNSTFDETFRIVRRDGAIRWLHARSFPVRDASGAVYRVAGITQDITATKVAEEALEQSRAQLRELAIHQETIKEEMRERIAREVHDELGQALVALNLDLHWLTQHCPPDQTEVKKKVAGMRNLIQSTAAAVQRIVEELRPIMLDDLGLADTLQWYTERFEARAGIKCRLRMTLGDLQPDKQCETAVYRLTQEALTNVARHSGASEANIRIDAVAEGLRLRISDNGNGIAPEVIENHGSFGLLGMRERVHGLKGDIRIKGRPGKGTTITVVLPA